MGKHNTPRSAERGVFLPIQT